MAEQELITRQVPPRFVYDWLMALAPELDEEQHPIHVTPTRNRSLLLSTTYARWGDLISRADCYADFTGEDYLENRGLVLSARALLRGIPDQLYRESAIAFRDACRDYC